MESAGTHEGRVQGGLPEGDPLIVIQRKPGCRVTNDSTAGLCKQQESDYFNSTMPRDVCPDGVVST